MLEWITTNQGKIKIISISTLLLILTSAVTCGMYEGETKQAIDSLEQELNRQRDFTLGQAKEAIDHRESFLCAISSVKEDVAKVKEQVQGLCDDIENVDKKVGKLEDKMEKDKKETIDYLDKKFEFMYKIMRDKERN